MKKQINHLNDKDVTESLAAARLAYAIGSKRGSKAEIARRCGVTPQAVNGWLKTGKIDAKHYPTIADVTGVNLHWLMIAEGEPYDKGGEPKDYVRQQVKQKTPDKDLQAETISKLLRLPQEELQAVLNLIDNLDQIRASRK